MASLARLQSSDCDNPALDIFTEVASVLTNMYSVEYQIFDLTTGEEVQVYPLVVDDKAAVNTAACPTGDRIGTGHYVAQWVVPSNENIGTHLIRWFVKRLISSTAQVSTEEFEVLSDVGIAFDYDARYCLVQDLRDEGVPSTGFSAVSDKLLMQRIGIASRFIERATGRFFVPRSQVLKLDGHGGRILQLDVPIIAVSTVTFETSPFQPSSLNIETDLLRVFNRHLTQGLTEPDDRDNPKIELYHASFDLTHASPYQYTRLIYPQGQQNITVTGVFGYTDPDGTSTGKTPDLIRHACKLMVMREIGKMGSVAGRNDGINRSRLLGERTRDQAYNLEPLGKRIGGLLTGDPEIDGLLATYVRPPKLGAT